MHPVVSVIIPTFNRASLLPRAIESVLSQTFANFELLIVDDRSEDETHQTVARFTDERIRFFQHDVNGGNAAARNTGIQAARGGLITFLDSDDEFLPEFLSTMVAALEGTPASVGFGWAGRYLVRSSNHGSDRFLEPDEKIPAKEDRYVSFLKRFRGGTNRGLMVKRECFNEVGFFDERLRAAVDTEFVLRLVRRYEYREVDRPLVCFHEHNQPRVSHSSLHKALGYRIIIEKNIEAIWADPGLWIHFHNRTARLFYEAGDRENARYFVGQVLRRRPLHLKTWLLFSLNETMGRRGAHTYRLLSRSKKEYAGPELLLQ
jgi:glycosyltransferase involved in cell wall biosynthesis